VSSVVRSVAVRLSAETSGYIAKMRGAAAATEGAAATMSRSYSRHSAEAQASLHKLESTAARAGKYVGLSLAGGMILAAKSAADFNAEMATVNTLAHSSPAEAAKLRSAALNVGTAWGYTATQTADAQQELVKAGLSTKDILGGALKGALSLAAAGQTDVASATEYAAAAMTQFRLKGKDVPHIADLLAAGADKALGSVTDLGYGLSQAGTTAHQAGLTIEQTTGVLAAFAQAGLTGERGGTAFKQMLLKLEAPSKKAQGLMDEYHLSLYKANGEMKTMPEFAGNLRDAFGKLEPAQRNFALASIFGARAVQAANILMAEGEKGITKWIGKVNDQGFAAHQASGKLDSLKGDLQKLKAEGLHALIDLGDGSQAPLRKLAQNVTKWLHGAIARGDLRRWGNNSAKAIQRVADVAGQVGHGLAPVARFVGQIVEDFTKLPAGLQKVILTGAVVGYAAQKTGVLGIAKGILGTGSKGGGATGLTGLAGRAGVVPVYVTNAGFGGGGVGGAPGGPGGRVPVGVPVGRPGPMGAPADWRIPTGDLRKVWSDFLDGTTAARKTIEGATGRVAGEGILKTVLRGLLGAPAWITAGDSGNEVAPRKAINTPLADLFALANGQKADWDKQIATIRRMFDLQGKLGKAFTSLPSAVAIKVSTPGAVESIRDISKLAAQYDLTPRQVRTLIEASGVGKANSDVSQLGRLYGLTPRQVRTLITQGGMDSSKAAIRELARLYGLTPRQVRTLINADPSSALTAIAKIKAQLKGIPRSISTQVYVNRVNANGKGHAPAPGQAGVSADGTTVPKTGRGYADRHLYLLADGEEVISNRHGQADRHRSLLKAINAGRLAGGGTAGTTSTTGKKRKKKSTAWKGTARYSFDLYGGQSARQVEREFEHLALTVRKHGGHLGRNFGALEKKAKGLEGQWDKSDKALTREINKRDDLVNQRDDLKSTVGDYLTRNPFDPGNVWMSPADRSKAGMGIFGTLNADIKNAARFDELTTKLKKAGVHGKALAAVQNQGIDAMAQLAGMSGADIRKYERLFDQRALAVEGAQKLAGTTFKPLIDAQNKVVDEARKTRQELGKKLDRLEKAVERAAHITGREVARGVNHAAANGKRGQK